MAASRFSERVGVKRVKTALQIRSMDTELRNGIWNVLDLFCWRQLGSGVDRPIADGRDDTKGYVRKQFFNWEWHAVYDFLEFTVEHFPIDPHSRYYEAFVNTCDSCWSAARHSSTSLSREH
jgi:hypothetical protein